MADATSAQPDVTLHLDTAGVIRTATLSKALSGESAAGWLGRPWIDTVGDFGGDKVRRMIEGARTTGVSAFRQVTQCFPSGIELPMEYTTVRLAGEAGLIAVGKNLQAVSELQSRLIAAQIAMERDYWKLRDVETRYRALFDASNDAVLLIRAADLQVVEANPAAIRALGIAPLGRDFLQELPIEERVVFEGMLKRVREHGRTPAVLVHLGSDRQGWMVRASLMSGERGQLYMLQLGRTGAPLQEGDPPPSEAAAYGLGTSSVENLIDRLPDGFVMIDHRGDVLQANRAFLDVVQMGSGSAIVGEPLRRWLSRPGADVPVLISGIRRHGTVRCMSTAILGELGLETEVEISAVGDNDASPDTFGVLIRDIGQRFGYLRSDSSASPAESCAEAGEPSLQTLVRQRTEALERQYIKAALARTGGNRTAAADLLGLSRQSLYAKLNRYGLDSDRHQTGASGA